MAMVSENLCRMRFALRSGGLRFIQHMLCYLLWHILYLDIFCISIKLIKICLCGLFNFTIATERSDI